MWRAAERELKMTDMSMTGFDRSEAASIADYLSAQELLALDEGQSEEIKPDSGLPARWVWAWPF